MRKWLKPEAWLLVSGVVLAAAVAMAGILQIAAPSFNAVRALSPITTAEAKSVLWAKPLLSDSAHLLEIEASGIGLVLVIYCISFIRSMNSNCSLRTLLSLRGIVQWLIKICAVAFSFAATIALYLREYFYDILPHSLPPMMYALIPTFILTWLILGWGCNLTRTRKGTLTIALIGALVGVSAVIFIFLIGGADEIMKGTYNVYHGGPGEFNPYIYIHFTAKVFLNIILLTIGVACVAMAMPFQNSSRKERIKWGSVTIALCLLVFIFSGLTYLNDRSAISELKKPLRDAAGLSMNGRSPWAIISLKDSKGKVINWPLEFKFRNSLWVTYDDPDISVDEEGYETYPATQQNLAKLMRYIEISKASSLSLQAYTDAAVNGHTALLDVRKARESVVRYSEYSIYYRLVAQAMFAAMPVTEDNKALFKEYAEGIHWYKDSRSAYWLCREYKQMDMAKDGEKWCILAREDSAGEPHASYDHIGGSITGHINFDDTSLIDGKIVLLWPPGSLDSISFVYTTELRRIIAVTEPGPKGEFEFTGLKAGESLDYELAVVFDHPLGYDVVGIDNPPGIINVTAAKKDIDLGVINIRTKKKDPAESRN